MSTNKIDVTKIFGLPEIPPFKEYINSIITPEMIVVSKCYENALLNEDDKNILKEAIEFNKRLFAAFRKIDLRIKTLDEAEALMDYFPYIFNHLFILQRDHMFDFLYRVTIVRDNDRVKDKIRNPSKLSFPPIEIIKEKKYFNRCSTYNKTLFYASFYKNVALMEMKPNKGDKIIISKWQTTRPDKKYVFFEIPNADVDNINMIEAKGAYQKALEGKDLLFQELFNITTAFIASEFVKEISVEEKTRNPYRLEYLFSAYVSDRLLNPPPQNGPITLNDLIMYPSVPWKHKQLNVAMTPDSHKSLKLIKAKEYLVGNTFYDKVELKVDEMPAELELIRESYDCRDNDIIWEDD